MKTLLFLLTTFLTLISAQDSNSQLGFEWDCDDDPTPTLTSSILATTTTATVSYDSVLWHFPAITPHYRPNTYIPSATDVPVGDSTAGQIFVCTDVEWVNCQTLANTTSTCHDFEGEYVSSISSIRPDKYQVCNFYTQPGCKGDYDALVHPGSSNLRGRRFDNKALSWECWADSKMGTT